MVVFQLKPNKSLGPDGILAKFYQKFWSVVGPDLLAIHNTFYFEKIDMARFNYEDRTLIPKCQGVDKLQAYRHICLLAFCFSFFTEIVNNRVNLVARSIVSPI